MIPLTIRLEKALEQRARTAHLKPALAPLAIQRQSSARGNPAPWRSSNPTCPASLVGGGANQGRDAPLRLAGGKLLRIHLMQRRGAVRGCRGHHREHAGHVQPHAHVLRENSETPAGLSLIYG